MEVKSRPGNRLIQITVSGKVVGQVTEKAYKEEGVMFAAVLLLYVVGAGFSKDVFTALKTGLLGEVADSWASGCNNTTAERREASGKAASLCVFLWGDGIHAAGV